MSSSQTSAKRGVFQTRLVRKPTMTHWRWFVALVCALDLAVSYVASSFTITTICRPPADLVPLSVVGTLSGTLNFFFHIGSALLPLAIGAIYGATGPFGQLLIMAGLVAVLGAPVFGLLMGRIQRMTALRPPSRFLALKPTPGRQDT